MALGSLADFKSYRNITTSSTAQDAEIQLALDAVIGWVAIYCGIQMATGSITEYIDGWGTDSFMLGNLPVTAVTSISLVNNDGSLVPLDTTQYRVDMQTGKVARINSQSSLVYSDNFGAAPSSALDSSPNFPVGFRNIQAVYTAGYAAGTNTPAELRWAIYQTVDEYISTLGFQKSNTNQFKVTVEEHIRKVRTRFDPFKRIIV